jgi:hypothetical protein
MPDMTSLVVEDGHVSPAMKVKHNAGWTKGAPRCLPHQALVLPGLTLRGVIRAGFILLHTVT